MKTFCKFFNKTEKERKERLTTKDVGYANAVIKGKSAPEPTTPSTATTSVQYVDAVTSQNVYYCWSHGVTGNPRHTSATCRAQSDGHKEEATLADIMGGCQASTKIQVTHDDQVVRTGTRSNETGLWHMDDVDNTTSNHHSANNSMHTKYHQRHGTVHACCLFLSGHQHLGKSFPQRIYTGHPRIQRHIFKEVSTFLCGNYQGTPRSITQKRAIDKTIHIGIGQT
jgi:hypothetical protein